MESRDLDRLRRKLRLLLVRNYEDQDVFPPGFFDTQDAPPVITGNEVEKCIGLYHNDRLDMQYMTRWVLSEAKCIFATLVLMKEERLIDIFYDHMQSDDTLPISKEHIGILFRNGTEENNTLSRYFYEKQWSLLAPSLVDNFGHKNLLDETILPFLQIKHSDNGSFPEYSVAHLISRNANSDTSMVNRLDCICLSSLTLRRTKSRSSQYLGSQ
jgi:hypothetical protein